jgi:peptide-methionine (S)-S-oxide reductase
MTEHIVLGGGCFWCLEAVYQQVKGVESVASGYAGGETDNPTYRVVCSGGTGHAEVVDVEFDPSQVSLRDLLEIFFVIHDPTTLNRQGADVGTQYRSVIFYQGESQKTVSEAIIKELSDNGVYKDPIVTQLTTLETFYPAEAYHQNYYQNHPEQGYCQVVINPKLEKFKSKFKSLTR